MPGIFFLDTNPVVEGFIPEYAKVGDLIIFQHGGQIHLREIKSIEERTEMTPLEASGSVGRSEAFANKSGHSIVGSVIRYYRDRAKTIHVLQQRQVRG